MWRRLMSIVASNKSRIGRLFIVKPVETERNLRRGGCAFLPAIPTNSWLMQSVVEAPASAHKMWADSGPLRQRAWWVSTTKAGERWPICVASLISSNLWRELYRYRQGCLNASLTYWPALKQVKIKIRKRRSMRTVRQKVSLSDVEAWGDRTFLRMLRL